MRCWPASPCSTPLSTALSWAARLLLVFLAIRAFAKHGPMTDVHTVATPTSSATQISIPSPPTVMSALIPLDSCQQNGTPRSARISSEYSMKKPMKPPLQPSSTSQTAISKSSRTRATCGGKAENSLGDASNVSLRPPPEIPRSSARFIPPATRHTPPCQEHPSHLSSWAKHSSHPSRPSSKAQHPSRPSHPSSTVKHQEHLSHP
mmetsp:Transcript_18020/g.44203  ORF Transcript_18020/g.44203 Transcript_18020/m.44203 type:complete len:205 (-) Transcript_18020:654-1268(-)